MPPSFFFLIDVSAAAAQSGALPVICATIKRALGQLPGGERTQIGIVTFDSTLHFYNLKSTLTQPQMLVRVVRLGGQAAGLRLDDVMNGLMYSLRTRVTP